VVVGDMEVTEAMTGATIEAMEVTAATIEATTEAMVVVVAAAAAAMTEMDVAAADEVIDFTLSLLCAVFASGTQNFTSSTSVIIAAFCSVSSSLDAPRYDTRCYFNVRAKADMSQLNLPHGNDN